MGSAQLLSHEGTRNHDLPDSSHQDQNEHKKAGEVVYREGQRLSEENEPGIQQATKDLKNSWTSDAAPLVRQHSGACNQQPQPPGQTIRWERFLPLRTLKVLLVENDDSTRHVLSALLRNCSYEVIAVANGLQAWRILHDLTNHIDIILTEVIMPGLNGIGLLSKIMSHITRKSIPVIMMSSHDSMGTVFKCLSRGAVDFLVKPIRKNELKNLWQHVWRRCHSSSGSGSESGTQSQKSVKPKSLDDSDNSRGSNNDDTASMDLNARDNSDIGSGTQSSWTKRDAEVSGPQPMSSPGQLADPLDSTCALVIHSTNDILCKDHMITSDNREKQDKKELFDYRMGNDLEMGECKNLQKQCETPLIEQDFTKQTGPEVDRLPEKGSNNKCCLGTLSTNILNEPSVRAANLIGGIASSFDSQVVSRVIQAPSGLSKASRDQDKANYSSDSASIKLSLKRLRSMGETSTSTQDEHNVLRRLNLSAFSRYNKSDASNQPQIGHGRSCCPLDNSSVAIKTVSSCYSMLNTAPLEQGSNGSSNNNDIGSTAKNTFKKPLGMKENTAPESIAKWIHSSACPSVQFRTLENQDQLQGSMENLTAPPAEGKVKEIQHQAPLQHHHFHQSNPHHYHNVQQPKPDQNDLTLESKAGPKPEPPQCGSSNVLSGPLEGNATDYSINGSNSGSNHGSDGNNENNNATQTRRSKTDSANAIAARSGSGSGNGSRSNSSSSGTDQNPLTHREAALKKFREKRKERNYEKKVRYQSRKRLAEQRPHVHGQFARKSVHEQTSGDAGR